MSIGESTLIFRLQNLTLTVIYSIMSTNIMVNY